MDILQNPFHILNASPRYNRRRLMELADECSLLSDSDECMEACSELTNPRKRLSAEVSWLPGIGPKRAEEMLSLLESAPEDLLVATSLPSIARTNLLVAGLTRLPDLNADDMVKWILEIASTFENIDANELSVLVNEERVVSGFPEVSDISSFEAEIQERRVYYRQVIKAALNNLSSKYLVQAVTDAVESATDYGEEECPVVIADIIDAYEVEAQGFFDEEEDNIKRLVEKLRTAVDSKRPDSTLASMVDQLITVVKNWGFVAQPIQVSAKSQGLDHKASLSIANLVRELAIHMYNEHGKLDFSQQLTNMLQEVFAEVDTVAERTAKDAHVLDEIAEQQVRLTREATHRAEEWRREITYEADVGAVFKDKLRISPEGIDWKKRHWTLDSITKIRWGGTRHSINGIPSGTTYTILFGNDSSYTVIELRREDTYINFIDRLWKSVGIRLLTECINGLRAGKKYYFGSAVMNDYGMELERKKFFGSNERFFCRWEELSIWNANGSFCIAKKEDRKTMREFSYLDEDNIHVLEAAIRMLLKKGGNRLSSILEE